VTFDIVDELSVDPHHGRLYEHGWQSWSPVGVRPFGQAFQRPETETQQVMRFRPETAAPVGLAQSEGLLLVQSEPGEPTRVYSVSESDDQVPSLRAKLTGCRLTVTANGPVVRSVVADDLNASLVWFGNWFAQSNDLPSPRPAPTIWCSWYQYFLQVTEADVLENLANMECYDLPIDVVQLDDGWQSGVGDWMTLSNRFASVEALAGQIRTSGRRAGIWLAPFMAAERSDVAREHPEWLLADAGWNWDQRLYGLDLTHPEVQEYLVETFVRLREWGFDYFKLDFLYAGALPGSRHEDSSGIAAYRYGLQCIRDAVGEDAYLVACGAPILPSAGLVDAMRVSPDTYHPDPNDPTRVQELRSVRGTVERAWQHGRFWVNDPDCLVLRPSSPWRAQWAAIVERYGGLRGFSDRIAELDDWGLETARRLLSHPPPATPLA
jgi:alpha-galactosidase